MRRPPSVSLLTWSLLYRILGVVSSEVADTGKFLASLICLSNKLLGGEGMNIVQQDASLECEISNLRVRAKIIHGEFAET